MITLQVPIRGTNGPNQHERSIAEAFVPRIVGYGNGRRLALGGWLAHEKLLTAEQR